MEKSAILLVNIFLGFTVIGWVIALIWSLSDSSLARMSKLDKLKKHGLISNSEYNQTKDKIAKKQASGFVSLAGLLSCLVD